MWLIAGLGNPGRKYQRNRHNIGFRVADELARRHGFGSFRDKHGGDMASGMLSIGGQRHKAVILKPTQFMNRSGFAVMRTARFFDIAPDEIIVIHDEIDIDFGRLKLKAGGGHGGHNGLRSIIAELGSRDFSRVRVGVGKPGPSSGSPGTANQGAIDAAASAGQRDRRVSSHVLSDFPSALAGEVDDLIGRAADATELIVSEGLRAAMNAFHTKPEKPEKPRKKKPPGPRDESAPAESDEDKD